MISQKEKPNKLEMQSRKENGECGERSERSGGVINRRKDGMRRLYKEATCLE